MSFAQKAMYYAKDLNFAVFPTYGIDEHGNCTCNGSLACGDNAKNAGKHPATRNGLKDATKETFKIRTLFGNRPYNIGIATGAISGIFVIDIDGPDGEVSFQQLQSEYGELPQTMTSLTGRGRHLLFKHPGIHMPSSVSKIAHKIDVRGDGGYIVAPPSRHKNGNYYEWSDKSGFDIADAPQWLIDLITIKPAQAPVIMQVPLVHDADDVQDMLDFLDPDMGYQDWINIGFALRAGGYPIEMFNNWSAKGSKYSGFKDIEFHWKSFRPDGGVTMGTLIQSAMLAGWQVSRPVYDEESLAIAREAADALLLDYNSKPAEIIGVEQETKSGTIPEVGGLIGETVDWIVRTAQIPQPELALINVIAALGAVFGRRYRSPMDTRTNIMMVGLAGTAGGKNHSKKCIKRLMVDAGLHKLLGGESIISGAGILQSLVEKPSQIMHLDEFGMVLEAMMDKRGAPHMRVASKVITELYSSSSEMFFGGQYADPKKEPITIASPNLCIFGISTEEKYTGGLSRDVISSGELNRFVVLKVKNDRPQRQHNVFFEPPSESLVKQWSDFKFDGMVNGMIEPEPIVVTWPGQQERINAMGDYEDDKIRNPESPAAPLWGRYRENVIKVAMNRAICRNMIKPEINGEDLDFAEALLSGSVEYMIGMATDKIADSQHERDCQDIVLAIKRNRGRMGRSALCRITQRMDRAQRDNALMSLIEQDKISVENPETDGKKSIVYRLAA